MQQQLTKTDKKPKPELIKSYSYNEATILRWIMRLYCPNGFELDPTYSKGNIYKGLPHPKLKFDLKPRGPETKKSDCRNLPLETSSINNIVFDPPFVIGGSPDSIGNQKKGSCIIQKRFCGFKTPEELKSFYIDSLKEFHRILAPGGFLIFKCQDTVSSRKQYLSHVFIINEAELAGFYTKDLFILLAKNRVIGKTINQEHARKFHCYYLVFQKRPISELHGRVKK
jgi:hypothetical protein